MTTNPTPTLPDTLASRFKAQQDGTYLYTLGPDFEIRLTPLAGPRWILDAEYGDMIVFSRSGDDLSRLIANAFLEIESLREQYARMSERMAVIVGIACKDLAGRDPSDG